MNDNGIPPVVGVHHLSLTVSNLDQSVPWYCDVLGFRQLGDELHDDGRTVDVWVYFYNAPLGRAPLIQSGDYLEHVRIR